MRIRNFLCLLLCTSAWGCATSYVNPHLNLMPESKVEQVIGDFTTKKKIYDGFQNTMEVSITMHNSEVLAALLDQNARIYQWNSEKYSLERNKLDGEKNQRSDYFLTFFVPEKRYDDLNKKNTDWKVFMDINGRRLEAKITKLKRSYADLRALYAHYNKFSTAYMLSFPISTAEMDSQPSSITLTGPVGSVQLDFKR